MSTTTLLKKPRREVLARKLSAPKWIRDVDPRAQDAFEIWKQRFRNPLTLRAYYVTVNQLCDWLEERTFVRPEQVDRELLSEFFADHSYSDSRQYTAISALRQLFDVMVEAGIMEHNPLPPSGNRAHRAVARISEGQLQKLLNSIDGNDVLAIRDKCIISLLAETGGLSMELVSLNIENFDSENRVMRLPGGFGGLKPRTVPVSAESCEILGEYLALLPQASSGPTHALFRASRYPSHALSDNRFDSADVGAMLRRRIEGAGLPPSIHAKSFRHSLIQRLLKTHPLGVVHYFSGHTDVRATLAHAPEIFDRKGVTVPRTVVDKKSR